MTPRPAGLPAWWEPLLTRVATARTEDFTPLTLPADGGRPSAVLVLLGEQRPGEPDLLVLQRAATMRTHAGQHSERQHRRQRAVRSPRAPPRAERDHGTSGAATAAAGTSAGSMPTWAASSRARGPLSSFAAAAGSTGPVPYEGHRLASEHAPHAGFLA